MYVRCGMYKQMKRIEVINGEGQRGYDKADDKMIIVMPGTNKVDALS